MKLNESPLYHLSSKKRLRNMLSISGSDNNKLFHKLEQGKMDDMYYPMKKKKKNGNGYRQINAPNEKLKKLQKRIWDLVKIIDRPEWVYGGEPKKSNITHAKVHAASKEIFKVDISDFFTYVSREKVFNFYFRKMKIEKNLAGILTNITTINNELPQGSAMSAVLSYYANEYMFHNLYEFSKLNNLKMTIYIDDIVFSSIHEITNFEYVRNGIIGIIISHGYKINGSKIKHLKQNNFKIITGVGIQTDGNIVLPYYGMDEIITLYRSLILLDDKSLYLPENRKNLLTLKGKVSYANSILGTPNQFTFIHNWANNKLKENQDNK